MPIEAKNLKVPSALNTGLVRASLLTTNHILLIGDQCITVKVSLVTLICTLQPNDQLVDLHYLFDTIMNKRLPNQVYMWSND